MAACADRLTCSETADFSQVEGNRILPFLFTLDLDDSVLFPGPGEKQKFCYEIEGVGEDTSRFADLSHFLFGICENITEEDFAEITVVVNGEPKQVIFGENVEIKTPDHPDNPTGCIGLKFDFPLDKVDGEMHVCFTLNRTFTVGSMNVCVFGGNTTATGLTICGPVCGEVQPCDRTFFQIETVCVPVTVTPFAEPGEATATCCGNPIVSADNPCMGNRKSCTFTIRQKLCIEIPIRFGAAVETGDAVVQCGDVSEEPCDCSAAVTSPSDTEETKRSRRYFGR